MLFEATECGIIWQHLLVLSLIIFQTIVWVYEVKIERYYNFLCYLKLT